MATPLRPRRRFLMQAAVIAAPWQAGCASGVPRVGVLPAELTPWEPVLRRWTPRQLLLLGEVHDNIEQHRSRLVLLTHLVAQGWRPAILMEQLDRGLQHTIDRVRKQTGAQASDILDAIRAADGAGQWDWPGYLPFIGLALRHDLPLVAANVSRLEARAIMSEGLRAHGFDDAIAPDIRAPLRQEILASHCGALPASVAERMVLAQVARDQFMARMLSQHGESGAVLLAGNTHVRHDVGVPRWLPPAARARVLSVGLLEVDDAPPRSHDVVRVTPAQARPDPCAAFRAGPAEPPAPRPASAPGGGSS